MATSVYFNNFQSSMEQMLIEDLVIESIKIYGHDVYYINRKLQVQDLQYAAVDNILNEDDLPIFSSAFLVEMYIKNVDGFEGDGDFLSKFGLEIRDEITFTVAQRVFEQEVGRYITKDVPNVGDLIYFPLNRKIFEIKFVEHESVFYQMGQLQTYDIRCDLYEYSQETFNTGVTEIDNVFASYIATTNTAIADVETVDSLADNTQIETAADNIIDFSVSDPFSEGGRW